MTKDQIKHHRAAFEQWQDPTEMQRQCEGISVGMTGAELFNQPGIQFVRDAWAAATFGDLRSVDEAQDWQLATR